MQNILTLPTIKNTEIAEVIRKLLAQNQFLLNIGNAPRIIQLLNEDKYQPRLILVDSANGKQAIILHELNDQLETLDIATLEQINIKILEGTSLKDSDIPVHIVIVCDSIKFNTFNASSSDLGMQNIIIGTKSNEQNELNQIIQSIHNYFAERGIEQPFVIVDQSFLDEMISTLINAN
jgi:hypothetical protein